MLILFKKTYLLIFSSPFTLSKSRIQVSNSAIEQCWTRPSIIHVSEYDLQTQAGYIRRKFGPSRNLCPPKTQHINIEKVSIHAYIKGVPKHDFRVRPAEGTKRLIPAQKPHLRNKTSAKKHVFCCCLQIWSEILLVPKNIWLVSGSLNSKFGK